MRELAIGDIHGCARSFETLLDLVQPTPTDTIILLGDYIDRGPDSCRVIDMILELNQRCTVVALTGNHEIMLQEAANDSKARADWWRYGGQETMHSYVKAGFAASCSMIS
jgi:serine/threonine protein phosphatase 1